MFRYDVTSAALIHSIAICDLRFLKLFQIQPYQYINYFDVISDTSLLHKLDSKILLIEFGTVTNSQLSNFI